MHCNIFLVNLVSVVQRAHDLAHFQSILVFISLFIVRLYLICVDCLPCVHFLRHWIDVCPKLVLELLHIQFLLYLQQVHLYLLPLRLSSSESIEQCTTFELGKSWPLIHSLVQVRSEAVG